MTVDAFGIGEFAMQSGSLRCMRDFCVLSGEDVDVGISSPYGVTVLKTNMYSKMYLW